MLKKMTDFEHSFLQVSHHPPVSALHATDEKENIEMIWCQNVVPKFNGNFYLYFLVLLLLLLLCLLLSYTEENVLLAHEGSEIKICSLSLFRG